MTYYIILERLYGVAYKKGFLESGELRKPQLEGKVLHPSVRQEELPFLIGALIHPNSKESAENYVRMKNADLDSDSELFLIPCELTPDCSTIPDFGGILE